MRAARSLAAAPTTTTAGRLVDQQGRQIASASGSNNARVTVENDSGWRAAPLVPGRRSGMKEVTQRARQLPMADSISPTLSYRNKLKTAGP